MRIERETMFMDIAETVAKRSTCLRNNVGAVIVDDNNNIISIGYNGVASGCPHCTTETCTGKGCALSIHAEINALWRVGSKAKGKSLYSTVMPCAGCALEIVRHKIKKVYYRYPYRDDAGVKYLLAYGVEVYRILPSGEIMKGWGQ